MSRVPVIEFLRAARRVWQRSTWTSLTAATAMAIGTALLVTIMSVIWSVFEADLPGVTEKGLHRVSLSKPAEGIESTPLSPQEYLWWQHNSPAGLDVIGAFRGTSATLTGEGLPAVRLNAALVTPSLLFMTGATPIHGSLLADPPTKGTVLLGFDVWSRYFGKDPSVIGTTIELDSQEVSVVGVMPDGFRFPLNQDLWFPLRVDPEAGWQESSLQAVVRVEPGFPLKQLRSNLEVSLRELRGQEADSPTRVHVAPYVKAYSDTAFQNYLSIVAWAALGVLLIAAANVSCVLVGRSAAKQPEMVMRRALGARGLDLVWAPLGEAFGLALVGCVAGFGLSIVVLRQISKVVEDHLLSYWITVRADARSVLLVLAAIALCVLLSAALPVVSSAWTNPRSGIGASRTRKRFGGFLRATLVVQIAISSGILFPTGALIQSLWTLSNYEPNIASKGVVRAQLSLPWSGYQERSRQAAFSADLREKLRDHRGIETAALASSLPGDSHRSVHLRSQGMDQSQAESAKWQAVTPGFFNVFGVEILAGRDFDQRDYLQSEPVVIVTESLARSFYGSLDAAIGRGLQFVEQGPEAPWNRIIGVVPDAIVDSGIAASQTGFLPAIVATSDASTAAVFRPLSQSPSMWLSVVAKTTLPAQQSIRSLHESVQATDPRVPLFWETTYEQLILDRTWDYRLFGRIFVALGLAALLMTIIGLFGVASLIVRERTPEIAVRKAVGASQGAIVRMIFGYGCATVALGLFLGHWIGYFGGRFLHSLFFQLDKLGLQHFIAVDLALPIAAILALLIPAKRAAEISPSEVLKAD